VSYALVLLNGPHAGSGLTLDPAGPPVTIGRHPSRDLPLDDQLCSRLHARLWHDGHDWWIEDCGSRNGTFLNSRRVERARVQPGDAICIGERLLLFVEQSPAAELQPWTPGDLKTTTFIERVPEAAQRQLLEQRLYATSGGKASRSLALLCRMATQLHERESVESLVKLVCETLLAGTRADTVAVWLAGPEGRLRQVARRGRRPDRTVCDSAEPAPEGPSRRGAVSPLASLVMQQGEALLVQQPAPPAGAGPETGSGPGDEVEARSAPASGQLIQASSAAAQQRAASAICVPIPSQKGRKGAIELHRYDPTDPFASEELDLTIAAAHQLGLALENLQHRQQLEQANEQLRERVMSESRIVGQSPAIRHLHEVIARVAPTDSTVLIYGESGTGKELVARLIHDASSRRSGPYVAVNCAAFQENLLESELFGHEKGAFTGADRRRVGQFERAHGGTIFLDEIGEMSLACQAKLLRILEGHEFTRLGGSEPLRVDVRIVAATHCDLSERVRAGAFREDLLFRLRVIELTIPPLRERGDDVLLLAGYFLEQYRRQLGRGPVRLSAEAARLVQQYHWPGNVRELKNAIERACVLGSGEEVTAADLGLPPLQAEQPAAPRTRSLAEVEREHILRVLAEVGGNKSKACQILGIGRATLYAKLRSFGRQRG